ncbi:MAG: serine hydrolase, partial [Planctomycetota bacterium]
EASALLVAHRGKIVIEEYDRGAGPGTIFCAWSVAKSILHSLVGIATTEGLSVAEPVALSAWRASPNDMRGEITLRHLLTMTSGLRFREDYSNERESDVIPMLFGSGRHDVAAFAANMPLVTPPGQSWSYSSGSSNIASGVLRDWLTGHGREYEVFVHERLFRPAGMTRARVVFDRAGTFVASSGLTCTGRDLVRFGELYRGRGQLEGTRILPSEWVDDAHVSTPECESRTYGTHFWMNTIVPGGFSAQGFGCQLVLIVPDRELVVVRLGRKPEGGKAQFFETMRGLATSFRMTRSEQRE